MVKDGTGKKAIKAGIGYTFGNILCKGLNFISAFIFARLMTPQDYGIYNTYSSCVALLTVIVGFALHASLKNAFLDYKKDFEEYCSSLLIPITLNAIIWIFFAYIFRNALATLITIPVSLIVFIVIEGFAHYIFEFYNNYLAVKFESKKYVILSITYALAGIILSVILILTIYSDNTYMGRVLGTTVPIFLTAVFVMYQISKVSRPKINIQYWEYGLKISLPIVPHGVSQIILAQFDRIMIGKISGKEMAGLYSFANNIGNIFHVITVSLDTAWTPWLFCKMEEKEYSLIKKVSNWYVVFVTFLASGLMLVSPELILIMGGKSYIQSKYVVVPIVLSVYFAFMYTLPSGIEYYYKKTKIIALGTMLAAILNVILNSKFIPRYGYVAAAYTTVFCYLFYYILHLIISKKIHGSMIYDLRSILGSPIFMVCFTMFCVYYVDNMVIRWGILIIIIAFIILALKKNLSKIKAILKEFR